MNTEIFLHALEKIGVTDFASYFRRLWIAVIPSALIGMLIGLTYGTLKGLLIGTAVGIAAPALLIWMAVTLVHLAIYMLAFAAMWTVIVYCFLYIIRWKH